MSTLNVNVTPGYNFADNEVLTPAKLRLLAQPTVDITGSISAASVADGSITETKLASSVVDTGMVGGAGTKIKAVVDDATLENSGGNYHVKDNGITAAKVKQVAFAYAAGVQTATVYAVTLSPVAAAYVAGLRVVFLADTANVGDVSLNVNALGNKHLYKNVSQALAAGDIQAGQIVEAFYDGTNFQIEALRTAAAITGASRTLLVKANSGTPLSKMDVTADEVILKTAAAGSVVLQTAVSVTGIDITTSGANGLDTGAEASSTWYYIWLIFDGTNLKGLLSISKTAPTLPAGYTYKALLGAVFNNGTSDFAGVITYGNVTKFVTTQQTLTLGTTVTIPHNLGVSPTTVQWMMVNTSTDQGYAPGDELDCATGINAVNTTNAFSTGKNATNIYVVPTSNTIAVHRTSDGLGVNIDPLKWKLVGQAVLL